MSSDGGVADVFEAPVEAVLDEEAVLVDDVEAEKEAGSSAEVDT
jgi:hypothetical protein